MYSVTWIDNNNALFSVSTPNPWTAWQLYRRMPHARVWRTRRKNQPQLVS